MFSVEVIERLFISPMETAKDFEWIRSNRVSLVVNCSKDIPNYHELKLLVSLNEVPKDILDWLFKNSNTVEYVRIPVDDNGREGEILKMREEIQRVIPIMLER